jgi:hypothetical protein
MKVVSYRDLMLFALAGLVVWSIYSLGQYQGEKVGREQVWAACHDPGNMACPAYNGGGGVDKAYVQ